MRVTSCPRNLKLCVVIVRPTISVSLVEILGLGVTSVETRFLCTSWKIYWKFCISMSPQILSISRIPVRTRKWCWWRQPLHQWRVIFLHSFTLCLNRGNGLKRQEIKWEWGKEWKWRKKQSPGGVPDESAQNTAFHMCASARMVWIPRQLVYPNNFYKGDPIKMSTEKHRAKPEQNHRHPPSQTLAAAISISIATITTIFHIPLVHTCNRASHKASIVRHICNQSIFKMRSSMFSSCDLISMCE